MLTRQPEFKNYGNKAVPEPQVLPFASPELLTALSPLYPLT
jgi:hypothetical protein